MESYFALVIGLIVVVVLAMALAAYNNRAEEIVPTQQAQPKSKSKKDKKTDKRKQVKGKQAVVEEETSGKKKKNKKKAQPAVKFTWDGTVENEDESMIELLKGSANYIAQEGRNEIKKKVNAVTSAVGQTVEKTKGKASKVLNDDNEEFEYVLMKRKKVDDKAKTKKKAAVKETPEGDTETAAASAEAPAGKKVKGFFKRGVFQSLRDAANFDKQTKEKEDEEKENARSKRSGKKETEEAEPAKDDKKDKPARAKKTGDAPNGADEGDQAVGPRQQRPRREPREPREPREAPPPPPRPTGGNFDVVSLDDMLSAISTHYGPKPKQNFAKLPPTVLFRLLRLLKVRDIVALSQVNHFLSKVSRDEKLWRNFCEKDFSIKIPNNKNQPQNQASKKKFRNVYKEEYLKSKKVATK